MRLSVKLSINSLLIILIFSGTITTLLVALSSTRHSYEEIINKDIRIAEHARELEILMLTARRNEKDFLLRFDET